MLISLLHSSKSMSQPESTVSYQQPSFLKEAEELMRYLKGLSVSDLGLAMKVSQKKSIETHKLIQNWNSLPTNQTVAIDTFVGDIYSGLQSQTLSKGDRDFANSHLLILSGLYGGLWGLDSIFPYRLEMAYKFSDPKYKSLYRFWDGKLASLIPKDADILNISSVEYTSALLPHVKGNKVITPKFLTFDSDKNQPIFVTVHAKVARGAMARWVIQNRVESASAISEFSELGYKYVPTLSTESEPVFVCKHYGGLGLSVRLRN